MKRFVVAVTGASGSKYAARLLQVLAAQDCEVHLTISPAAVQVMECEVGITLDLQNPDLTQFAREAISANRICYHHFMDFSAGIASGSFRTDAMVICPCSMGTLSSIAGGLSSNLIHRAADVHLKERRKLIVVPRETPLGQIQLENMLRLTQAGAVILPAMPGFYHNPLSIDDLVDFVVARICDQLGVDAQLASRWSESD